jgi:hypothetical protein
MQKLTLTDLSNIKSWKNAVIVIDNKSFLQNYSIESRSYLINRDTSKYFQEGKISNSIWGDAMDESDFGVRLDWYLWGNEFNWKIEYCYIKE